MLVGAQLYTVRDYCKTLPDFAETLKKIADIGYTTVQVSGTCEYEADWLKEQLDKTGLKCVLTHIPNDVLAAGVDTICKNHDVFDCKYVGLGWYGFNEGIEDQTYDNFFKVFLPVAKALKEQGKYFMYHNHAHEFCRINGRPIIEMLAEQIPADLMGFTLDTFWVQAGGADPAQWLEKLKGRVPVIHLKDHGYYRSADNVLDKRIEVLGEGNLNFDRVFEKAESAGTKYMMVEQDDCNGENPFDCLTRSYAYLKSHGFN